MINPIYDDVKFSSWVNFNKPRPDWAEIETCGNFPCTALHNVVVDVDDA
jgi:hypothetical protein